MPLVEVDHRGVDAQRVEGPDSANAEQQFLPDADAGVSAVEPAGQGAVRLTVLRHVAIEQQERGAADLDSPDLRVQGAQPGVDLDADRFAVGAEGLLDRQPGRFVVRVVFVLPAFGVEGLSEVAFGVQNSHGHQGQSQVAGALEMVTGQHAEAARVDRQAFVQAELHREVGHGAGTQGGGVQRFPNCPCFPGTR